jgi:uncharacterized protein (TIGR02391 family)
VGDQTVIVLDLARAIATDIAGASIVPAARVAPPAPPAHDVGVLYDAIVTDADLRALTRKVFLDGHYALAVEQACKLVNNTVKNRCGKATRGKDGADLMHHAFRVDSPVLKLNPLKTVSQRDEQNGYRLIFAGMMAGMRNPRAHEHLLRDEAQVALEMLAMANHLLAIVGRSTRTRARKTAETAT